jgi:hypothetical protein
MGEGQVQLVYNMFTNVSLTTLYHNMSKGRYKKRTLLLLLKESVHVNNPIISSPMHCKRMNDYCLTTTQQVFSFIMARTGFYFDEMIRSTLY